jgi:hypothetical protein
MKEKRKSMKALEFNKETVSNLNSEELALLWAGDCGNMKPTIQTTWDGKIRIC